MNFKNRASDRIRTGNDLIHSQALCQLSYAHHKNDKNAPAGIRTRISHQSGAYTL